MSSELLHEVRSMWREATLDFWSQDQAKYREHINKTKAKENKMFAAPKRAKRR